MDREQELINIFDSCWFSLEIFKKQIQTPNSGSNPDHQIQENPPKLKFSSLPSIHMGSTASLASDSLSVSPDSVIFSTQPQIEEQQHPNRRRRRRRSIAKKGLSKSLSELEFEELKGFMDLGFVFPEEDVDPGLAEIVPGLQRFCKKVEENKEKNSFDESSVARPYLSEAWGVLERSRREKPFMDWRIPDLGSEIDVKDSLKLWAHSVASAVR